MDDRTRTRKLPDGSTLRVNFTGEQKPAKAKAKGSKRRYVFHDRDATTSSHMRRPNTAVNPRYRVLDTETNKVVDEFTSAKVARDTARDMNRGEK